MSRIILSTLIVIALASAAAPARAQDLVTRFELTNTAFSPDGDGKEDTTRVNTILGVPATSVSIVVFAADSITPVDTLLAPAPHADGFFTLGWKGLASSGSPIPDGFYVVTLKVSGAGRDTTVTRPAVIDTGAPVIVINSVEPYAYAPGVPNAPAALVISFTYMGATPLYTVIPTDEVHWTFINPQDAEVVPDSISVVPRFAGVDGTYEVRWTRGEEKNIVEGEYVVTLTAVDQAAHSASNDHTFILDLNKPEVKVTNVNSGTSFRQAPANLIGWARDGSGLDSLVVRYSDDGDFIPLTIDRAALDTTYFHAPLADSLSTEGKYHVSVRVVDNSGRATQQRLNLTVDRTAPDTTAHLDEFSGEWHASRFRLTGTFPSALSTGSRVRIYRNDAVVDSFFTQQATSIDLVIDLIPGRNTFVATLVDGALNEGPPSNAVVVTFDDASGLYVDTPVRPGATFDVNLSAPAVGVTLRLYDMAGGLVVALEDPARGTSYSLPWDGQNGNGHIVKKGPLVAVVTATLEAGGTRTFREMILFDPDVE